MYKLNIRAQFHISDIQQHRYRASLWRVHITQQLQYIQDKSCLKDTNFATPWIPLSET